MCTITGNHLCMVPAIWSTTDRIFCHFRLFFAILPSNNLENQNFEKIKKILGDIISGKYS